VPIDVHVDDLASVEDTDSDDSDDSDSAPDPERGPDVPDNGPSEQEQRP
jgi:hypothetical protein